MTALYYLILFRCGPRESNNTGEFGNLTVKPNRKTESVFVYVASLLASGARLRRTPQPPQIPSACFFPPPFTLGFNSAILAATDNPVLPGGHSLGRGRDRCGLMSMLRSILRRASSFSCFSFSSIRDSLCSSDDILKIWAPCSFQQSSRLPSLVGRQPAPAADRLAAHEHPSPVVSVQHFCSKWSTCFVSSTFEGRLVWKDFHNYCRVWNRGW